VRLVRKRTTEDGATAVEFALVLPIFVMLVFGIIAFGFAYATWTALEGGAREGARYMAVHSAATPAANGSAATLARQAAALPCGTGGTGCTVGEVPAGARCSAPTQNITYTAAAKVDLMIPFVANAQPTLRATAVMRCGG